MVNYSHTSSMPIAVSQADQVLSVILACAKQIRESKPKLASESKAYVSKAIYKVAAIHKRDEATRAEIAELEVLLCRLEQLK